MCKKKVMCASLLCVSCCCNDEITTHTKLRVLDMNKLVGAKYRLHHKQKDKMLTTCMMSGVR